MAKDVCEKCKVEDVEDWDQEAQAKDADHESQAKDDTLEASQPAWLKRLKRLKMLQLPLGCCR